MTYSIVARDPDTGELGVAVQTCWPMVGAAVPWIEAGVGAVATQASTNVDLGPIVLAFLREGQDVDTAMRSALAADTGVEVRQLAVVDAQGRAAVHTGESCVAEAGHVTATDVACQGNMLAALGTPEAMLRAFATARGDLAERMLAALVAAEEAGGDIRGSRSASLVVAPGGADARPWSRRFDLRVDDATAPLDELARLLRVARAFEALESALAAAEANDLETAVRGTTVAYELAPDDAQIALWHGLVLVAQGQSEAGQSLLVSTLRAEPRLAAFSARRAQAEPDSPLAPALREVARLI